MPQQITTHNRNKVKDGQTKKTYYKKIIESSNLAQQPLWEYQTLMRSLRSNWKYLDLKKLLLQIVRIIRYFHLLNTKIIS
jgi:hypothetical protein